MGGCFPVKDYSNPGEFIDGKYNLLIEVGNGRRIIEEWIGCGPDINELVQASDLKGTLVQVDVNELVTMFQRSSDGSWGKSRKLYLDRDGCGVEVIEQDAAPRPVEPAATKRAR